MKCIRCTPAATPVLSSRFIYFYTHAQHFLITDLSLCFLLRYYFKKASDEFECGAVFEEVLEDANLLPMYEGKVLGKVERMD